MTQTQVNMGWICDEAAEEIRNLIRQYNGNEVFMIGTCDPSGFVTFIEPIAYGNKNSVPAPAQAAMPGQILLHNHPSGVLEPSGADISIASVYGKAGIGFYITNNAASDVRTVVKPFFPKATEPIDFGELEDVFGETGVAISRRQNFEFRPQQLQMMEAVTRAFNDSSIAVIEAGTGVGKSYGYLAPSILWALKNKKRVVVSTNTINLQEQILNKDLPELARQLGKDFKAVLVKGRSNYISLRRLEYAKGRSDLFLDDRTGEMASLKEWAQTTLDGSRADLSFTVSEDTWDAVMSDKDDCLRAACPHFNKCHYYNSRREAANADIIVANHHLVMADVSLRQENSGTEFGGILPPFDRVIFDEAHNLEEVATSYFTAKTSLSAIRRQLFRISRLKDRSGALQAFTNALRKHKLAAMLTTVEDVTSLIFERILPVREELETNIRSLFDEWFFLSSDFFITETLQANDSREFRINTTIAESEYWAKAAQTIKNAANELARLMELFKKLESLLANLPDEIADAIQEQQLRLFSAVNKLGEHEATLRFFLSADNNEFCRWIEMGYRRGQPYIFPHTAPLDIAQNLKKSLFAKKNTVILTSATLCVDNGFQYFGRQIGLIPRKSEPTEENSTELTDKTTYLKLDTPFNYAEVCMLGVPRDLAVPSERTFLDSIAPVVLETIKITKGRALVLFTAYSPLRKLAQLLEAELKRAGIELLAQGQMPRHQLTDQFKASDHAVLFATSSFWEGVDIQGDALQCLIITKLPFSVPSAPIFEARAEKLERSGGNPFYEIAVPQAVIKFKQGFGRLIRSKRDRGIVLITDNRVLSQRYGKVFMKSLPPAKIVEGDSILTVENLKAFMKKSQN